VSIGQQDGFDSSLLGLEEELVNAAFSIFLSMSVSSGVVNRY